MARAKPKSEAVWLMTKLEDLRPHLRLEHEPPQVAAARGASAAQRRDPARWAAVPLGARPPDPGQYCHPSPDGITGHQLAEPGLARGRPAGGGTRDRPGPRNCQSPDEDPRQLRRPHA